MDLNDNDSDQDIFSEDDGTGDVEFKSPDASKKSPTLTLSQTSTLTQHQEETPDRAMVPKTPLSLAPFMSKADAWTSDMETPEIDRSQLPHYSRNVSPNGHDDFNHDETLTQEQVLTPVISDRHSESDEANEEIVPASQPQFRRSKRRLSRRIFDKNSTNCSPLRDDEDSDDSTTNNINNVKKSQSCIEYSERIPPSPIRRTNRLRELQRKMREKTAQELAKKEITVPDEEFTKVWRALEMGDRVNHQKNHQKPEKSRFPLNEKKFDEQMSQQSLLSSKLNPKFLLNEEKFEEQMTKKRTLSSEKSSKLDSKFSLNEEKFNKQMIKQNTFLLSQESSKLETNNDILSPVDLGFDDFDEKNESLNEKTFIVDDNEESYYETLDVPQDEDENEDEDEEPFKGFSTADQNHSKLLIPKFQHLFESDYDGKLSEKGDFKGFSFAEIESTKTIFQNHQVLLDNHLEKYHGIMKNVEEPLTITTEEEELSQGTQTTEESSELPILPPLSAKVRSEFDTASGKKLFTAIDKIVKAEKILLVNEDIIEHSIDQLLTLSEAEIIKQKNADENEVESSQLEKAEIIEKNQLENDVKNVESDITTVNTLEIAPSPGMECDIKVPEFKVPMQVEESVELRDNCGNSTNFSFVGFQTGLGKPVEISETALSKAAGVYEDDAPEDYADCLNELSDWKSRMLATGPRKSAVGLKKSAGGFKPLLPKPKIAIGNSGQFKSVFNQNSVKNFEKKPLFSRTSVLQNEVPVEKQQFGGFKTKEAAKTPVSSTIVSGDVLEACDFPDEQWDDIEDFSELKLPDLPTIENNVALGGFTTGTGKKVQISDEALTRGRAMYAVAQKEAEADCEKENDFLEKGETKSSIEIKTPRINNFNENTPDLIKSAKRKDFDDEVTPFGRKRAKIGGSDLQGRNLFSEIEEEDRELMQSATIETDSVHDRILPFKNSVTEELKKTTFFNGFNKNSSLISRRSDTAPVSVPIPERNRAEKRPHSFPDSTRNEKKKVLTEHSSQDETIPDDLVFDSQEFLDSYAKISAKLKFNDEAVKEKEEAIKKQEEIIEKKRIIVEKRRVGKLFEDKKRNNTEKIKLQDLCYPGRPPVPRSSRDLVNEKLDAEILSINSSTAKSYQFHLPDFYENSDKNYAEGIVLGDGATLIPNESNKAGITEFTRSFLASPGVVPSLLPNGWIENHYKWIIWKLASMDRVKFSKMTVTRSLTPDEVLKQLKYRYDREIDHSQRPIIRRILEKDEAPSNRMLLLVSKIVKFNANNRTNFALELTDGWYSVMAALDTAMINYIHAGKITEGMKLMIYGATLINLEEGCHPLEISDSVRLKIYTNSTRRAKWFAKLGLQRCNGPMELKLKDINRSGGLIGKVTAVVSRVYPIMYKETFPDGEIAFRNARSEERAQLLFTREQEGREETKIFRDVKPCLKIRIADDESTGIVTIWQNAEECIEMFKEGSTISIIHGTAGDKLAKDLQINATRWTTFDVKKGATKYPYPARKFTPLPKTIIGFNPIYGEFDTVGVIVSIGPAPHGMKNFETVNLAYRNEFDEDSFLSLLFWHGVSSYGYADIATVGAIICCFNCEWRKNLCRSIPTAVCSERTIITRNPKVNSHLKREFDELKKKIGGKIDYVDDCALIIHNEVIRKSGSTPNSFVVTPSRRSDSDAGDFTPKSGNLTVQKRLEKLQSYGSAPKLSPINLAGSRRVSMDFKSPLTNATRFKPSGSKT